MRLDRPMPMARTLASFLALAWAASASVLRGDLATQDPGALKEKELQIVAGREAACRSCNKLCPINCFVGTCGLHTAFSVRKYESTNQCYSCDPSVSVGISRDGDFLRCTASESGQPEGGDAYSQQQSIAQGPQGPAIPGDAGLNALKATQQAQLAVAAATSASIYADKAAKAATAKYREVTGGAGGQAFSDEQNAQNHQAATQIRAEEALRVSEAAHTAWKVAMGAYNRQVQKLRKEQLLTDQAEKTLEAAEQRSEKARGAVAMAQAAAQHAIEQAMLNGGSAASKITSQAAAEELAGAAMAAHRRLVTAAKEAKDASEKIAMANAMAPCMDTTDSSKNGIVGCTSLAAAAQHAPTPQVRVAPVNFAMPPPPQAAPVSFGGVARSSIAGLDDDVEEPAVPMMGQLQVPSLEEQMTSNLAEKLAASPNAVQDASLFAVPSIPFSAEQSPMDGTEHVPSFDLSTVSALQKGSYKRLLRQNK